MAKKPLKWIREATADEIAEALIASNPVKAGEVAMRVTHRIAESGGDHIDATVDRIKKNPSKAVGAFFKGLGSLMDD